MAWSCLGEGALGADPSPHALVGAWRAWPNATDARTPRGPMGSSNLARTVRHSLRPRVRPRQPVADPVQVQSSTRHPGQAFGRVVRCSSLWAPIANRARNWPRRITSASRRGLPVPNTLPSGRHTGCRRSSAVGRQVDPGVARLGVAKVWSSQYGSPERGTRTPTARREWRQPRRTASCQPTPGGSGVSLCQPLRTPADRFGERSGTATAVPHPRVTGRQSSRDATTAITADAHPRLTTSPGCRRTRQ
jgi:hypothetical protein